MQLINSSIELVPQPSGVIGGYKHIEKAARICYKSEDKIDEDSYNKILEILNTKKHYSPLEHFSVYLTISEELCGKELFVQLFAKYRLNPYTKIVSFTEEDKIVSYITTNFRVIVENNWQDDLKYLTEPTKHLKRISVKVTCSRDIAMEFIRHRSISPSMESTRYCNYSKGKFGTQLTYIIPSDVQIDEGIYNFEDILSNNSWDPTLKIYLTSLCNQEKTYFSLLSGGWKPQQARRAIPGSLKTEVMFTGFVEDWKHFFDLRCSPAAHPDMREVANMIKNEFIDKDIINNEKV